MKAIQTIYDGYKFRSRLEARWAMVFKELGVYYEYEPEGFDLDSRWYLPDFYLPETHYWIEIKPLPFENNNWFAEAIHLCKHFRDKVGPIILLCGTPGKDFLPLFFDDDFNGMMSDPEVEINKRCLLQIMQFSILALNVLKPDIFEPALLKARQARFEKSA